MATGYAVSAAGIAALNSASYAAGATSGFGFGQNILLPIAGLVSGWGGILQAIAPYAGEFGLGAIVAGGLVAILFGFKDSLSDTKFDFASKECSSPVSNLAIKLIILSLLLTFILFMPTV